MKYNDFLLPQNWESLAKAYSQNLKNKGFVFVRLNENQNHTLSLANNYANLLEQALTLYKQAATRAKGFRGEFANNVIYHTKNTLTQLDKFYPVNNKPSQSAKIFNAFSFLFDIIALEAKILRAALLLLEQEDNTEKHSLLKNNLMLRLQTLEQIK